MVKKMTYNTLQQVLCLELYEGHEVNDKGHIWVYSVISSEWMMSLLETIHTVLFPKSQTYLNLPLWVQQGNALRWRVKARPCCASAGGLGLCTALQSFQSGLYWRAQGSIHHPLSADRLALTDDHHCPPLSGQLASFQERTVCWR